MPQYLEDNEATAVHRRTYFLIFADDGSPWAGSVSGVKALRSVNGATETPSTNDIVRVGGLWHYVEWTQAETNTNPKDRILARVPAASGRREAVALVDVGANNIFAAEVAPAALGEQVALTMIGGADLRFDDTDGATLRVQRKSTSAVVATVPLRRGTRTQPIIGNG